MFGTTGVFTAEFAAVIVFGAPASRSLLCLICIPNTKCYLLCFYCIVAWLPVNFVPLDTKNCGQKRQGVVKRSSCRYNPPFLFSRVALLANTISVTTNHAIVYVLLVQADVESFTSDCGALSTSLKANRLVSGSLMVSVVFSKLSPLIRRPTVINCGATLSVMHVHPTGFGWATSCDLIGVDNSKNDAVPWLTFCVGISWNYLTKPFPTCHCLFCPQYATSCPANLGAHFGRPPGSKLSSMSVVEEGALGEEEGEEGSPEPKSMTALSILESLASAGQTVAAPAEGSGVEAESVESTDSVEGSPIEDDVFELEGLDGLDGVRKWELKSRPRV